MPAARSSCHALAFGVLLLLAASGATAPATGATGATGATEAEQATGPPNVDRLSPPGGQRGTTVSVTLAGYKGDAGLQAWSDRGELTFQFPHDTDAAETDAAETATANANAANTDTDGVNTVEVAIPPDARPGVHWFRFYTEHGSTGLLPFVVGLVPEQSESEPNNTLDAATEIPTAAATVNGVLEKNGKVDVFAIDVPEGCTLVASMTASRILGSPMDGVLEILNRDGTIVAANDDDHGPDPLAVYHCPTAQRCYVRTYAFPETPNSSIRFSGGADFVYRLTISTEPFVTHTVPATADPEREQSVIAYGWNLPEPPPQAVIPPSQSESVILDTLGTRSVTISAAGIPAMAETGGADQVLQSPMALTGVIATPGEQDSFPLQGNPGQQLQLRVLSRSLNSLLDPVLTVRTADGTLLKEADDISRDDLDVDTSVKLPDSGECTVTVSDRFGHGSPRHFYVLVSDEPHRGFRATVKSDRFTLSPAEPLEIPLDIERTGGFDSAITLRVAGLPPGLLAEPVTSEPEGDSAKAVSLQVTAEEPPAATWQGVIRIVGVPADSASEQYATTTLPADPLKTPDLWLTVPPPEPAGPSSEPE